MSRSKRALIEDVYQSLAFNHLLEFAEKGGAVVGLHFLDAHALANGLPDGAHLADFHHSVLVIHNHLDFFLAQFVAVKRQRAALGRQHGRDNLRVEKNVAVEQQEVASLGIGPRQPQREDVVVVGIVGIIDEMDGKVGIMRGQEVANHLRTVARHHHQFADSRSNNTVDRAL